MESNPMDYDNPVYHKERNDAAIEHVCAYFDSANLTLFERWHVCHCIAMACVQAMAPGMREVADEMRAIDIDKVKSSLGAYS